MMEQGVQTESPAEQGLQSNLSEPHFDDIAIAIAQPVEPLPEKKRAWWQELGVFRRHVSTRALLVILAAAVGFASVTFGLAGVQRLTAEQPQSAITPMEKPIQTEAEDTSNSVTEKNSSPRSAVRKILPRAKDPESKPVARKVGEIH